jgi:hypothetical protein
MTSRPSRRLGVGLVAIAVLAVAAAPAAATAARAKKLKGTFELGAGSYFRMLQPAAAGGGYFSNPYSTDSDKTYTPVTAGEDGGIETGKLQPAPSPAFDAQGNSLANLIITPASFTGINFGLATVGTAPSISVKNGKLSGQLTGFTAEWNNQTFPQGSSAVKGTYNVKTRKYVLTWKSLVSGGPFNGFTGDWHLQGKFKLPRVFPLSP